MKLIAALDDLFQFISSVKKLCLAIASPCRTLQTPIPFVQAPVLKSDCAFCSVGSVRYRRGMIVLLSCDGPINALVAIVAFAIVLAVVWVLSSSSWPVTTTLRHIASAPNCEFARLVGLAPAGRGEPGYWKHHDRDRDGVACEPWPQRR